MCAHMGVCAHMGAHSKGRPDFDFIRKYTLWAPIQWSILRELSDFSIYLFYSDTKNSTHYYMKNNSPLSIVGQFHFFYSNTVGSILSWCAAFLQCPRQVFMLVEVASCCWQVHCKCKIQMRMQIQKIKLYFHPH
jgi:hypothetical protein